MRPFDFENSIGFWICTTAHMFRKRLDERLAKQGVTSRQWELLAVLAMYGPMPQRQLADALGIEAPALAGLVSRMERDGWLLRDRSQTDRRKMVIRPAEKAEEVWSSSVDYFRELREIVTRGLSEADLKAMRAFCDRVQENLKESDELLSEPDKEDDGAVDLDAIGGGTASVALEDTVVEGLKPLAPPAAAAAQRT